MGKILIYSNNSGGGGGADVSVVTANASDVLAGKVFVNADEEIIVGEMPNIGAASQMLNAGESYNIPKGYHNGSGSITAQSLTNQTGGTATATQILNGQTAWVNGNQITGSMADNGAVSPSALGAGGSYTIPAGYHNGNGKVTVQSLATITASGDATAGQILKGKKAYVDGTLLTGTMVDNSTTTSNGTVPGINTTYSSIPTREGTGLQYAVDTAGTARISLCPPTGYYPGGSSSYVNRPASEFGTVPANKVLSGQTFTSSAGLKVTGTMAVTSAISFKATAQSTSVIRISWTNPSKGPWEGVKIRMSTSGNPGVSGGTLKYTGKGSSSSAGASSYVDITGLSVGTTYYFTCYSYATGLGDSSTSYNVSAKTKGLVLYSYGNNYASIDDYYTSKNYVKNESDRLYNYNNLVTEMSISSAYRDISNYTKMVITIMFTKKNYSIFSFSFSQGSSYPFLYTTSPAIVANTKQTFTLDISAYSSMNRICIGQSYQDDEGWWTSGVPYYIYEWYVY